MRSLTPTQKPEEIEQVASNWIVRRDAGLTAEEEADFARWRSADPRHEEVVARKERAWATLGRPLDAGQAGRLLGQLANRAARRRRRKLGATAAAALLLLAMGAVSIPRMSTPAVVARGEVLLPETRTLTDGSVAELRPGAELAVAFDATRRLVRLTAGTAHFQVTEDKARPFVVQAGAVEFRAVGTAFSVEVSRGQAELLVTQGRVAVDKSAAAGSAGLAGPAESPAVQTLAHVDAGNRMVVDLAPAAAAPAASPNAVSTNEMNERLAWRVPRLEFSELPLSEAVRLMNRYNRVQFSIDDPDLPQLRISGLFRADNTDTFVRLLEATCGIRAEHSGDLIVLRKAAP